MRFEDVIKSSNFRDEKHKATIHLIYTAYWLKNQISKEMKTNGVTLEQFNILRILNGRHPEQMCIKDIADRMIEKSSNVPRIIDRLIVKKLVKRATSKVDKRETLVSLTEKGMVILTDTNRITEFLTNSVVGLNDEEALALNTLLEKMRSRDLHG